MLWYIFVWFYLYSDHAPWWVIALAVFATLVDIAKSATESTNFELQQIMYDVNRVLRQLEKK